MPLSDAARAALLYWEQIQRAAAMRGNVAGAFDEINTARAAGLAPDVPVTMLAVGELYSAAAQTRNATEALGLARQQGESMGLSQQITSDMMSLDISARASRAVATFADYYVRFEAQFTTPLGTSYTQMLTAKYDTTNLPATVGELVDALGSFGESNYAPTGGTFDGVGDISISAA